MALWAQKQIISQFTYPIIIIILPYYPIIHHITIGSSPKISSSFYMTARIYTGKCLSHNLSHYPITDRILVIPNKDRSSINLTKLMINLTFTIFLGGY